MPSQQKTFSLLFESLSLKKLPRMGWVAEGAPRESLADHSFGAAVIALALARMEGLDEKEEAKLVRMALLHDMHECRIGDLSRLQRQYVAADCVRAEKELFGGTHLEGELELLQAGKASRLAALCKDADKLDMLFQAIDYSNRGSLGMGRFIRSALKQIKSASGKKLARMALKKLRRKRI
ncbi:MAG: HD domain-containing protein [Candidatus Micrarchaeota archaeon]|nr:HD domain-containing protein [Candidatus Micrarchaeota archaeon]